VTPDFETNDHNGIRQIDTIDWLLGKKVPVSNLQKLWLALLILHSLI